MFNVCVRVPRPDRWANFYFTLSSILSLSLNSCALFSSATFLRSCRMMITNFQHVRPLRLATDTRYQIIWLIYDTCIQTRQMDQRTILGQIACASRHLNAVQPSAEPGRERAREGCRDSPTANNVRNNWNYPKWKLSRLSLRAEKRRALSIVFQLSSAFLPSLMITINYLLSQSKK